MEEARVSEAAVRKVIAKIERAWRSKQLAGLDDCFHDDAVIVGDGHVEYARGREKCAESYREFATNASITAYSESSHALRTWGATAVYTFAWEMTYQRDGAPKSEVGTDQLVFERTDAGWKLVWRCIHFEPAKPRSARVGTARVAGVET